MQHLPATPDLAHLKKQAKTLLRAARAGEPATLQRFAAALPAMRGASRASREFRLHDAHSVVAREYGFKSWPELRRYVEWKRTVGADRLTTWLGFVYEGHARERRVAVRLLREAPDLFTADLWVACAVGADPARDRGRRWLGEYGRRPDGDATAGSGHALASDRRARFRAAAAGVCGIAPHKRR
jgi:hypothetical protein